MWCKLVVFVGYCEYCLVFVGCDGCYVVVLFLVVVIFDLFGMLVVGVNDVEVYCDFGMFVDCVCCVYVGEIWIVLLLLEVDCIGVIVCVFDMDFVDIWFMLDFVDFMLFYLCCVVCGCVFDFVVVLLLVWVLVGKVVFDCVFVGFVLIVFVLLMGVIVIVVKCLLLGLVLFW